MEISKNFHFLYGLFSANVGIIKSFEEVALVDSGFTEESVDTIVSYLELIDGLDRVKYVFLTHGDPDHIGGAHRFQREYGAQVVIHEKEIDRIQNPPSYICPSEADIALDQDRTFQVGRLRIRLMPTPGHSAGSICIYVKKQGILFTGDTIVGPSFSLRTPFSEYERNTYTMLPIRAGVDTYLTSLRNLCRIKSKWLLPGHGKPVFKKTHATIASTIRSVEGLKGKLCSLLDEELCPSELAVRMNIHESLVKEVVDELVNEGLVIFAKERCVKKEPFYKRADVPPCSKAQSIR
jgi:glyoxylase-like metal-dependent hydrolase (beta-lactamase superfamily II)